LWARTTILQGKGCAGKWGDRPTQKETKAKKKKVEAADGNHRSPNPREIRGGRDSQNGGKKKIILKG